MPKDWKKHQGVTSVQIGGSSLWGVFWLFTIGFANLSFGSGFLAILLWLYYLGAHLSALYGG